MTTFELIVLIVGAILAVAQVVDMVMLVRLRKRVRDLEGTYRGYRKPSHPGSWPVFGRK